MWAKCWCFMLQIVPWKWAYAGRDQPLFIAPNLGFRGASALDCFGQETFKNDDSMPEA